MTCRDQQVTDAFIRGGHRAYCGAYEGHELAWTEQLQALPPAMRPLLEEELALRDFVPEISRLQSVSTFGTPSICGNDGVGSCNHTFHSLFQNTRRYKK